MRPGRFSLCFSNQHPAMDFYLEIDRQASSSPLPALSRLNGSQASNRPTNTLLLHGEDKHTTVETIPLRQGQAWIVGDPIYHTPQRDASHALLDDQQFGRFFRAVDGFYFLIHWHRETQRWTVGSSMFSILPVYYAETGRGICIASSFDLVRNKAGIPFTDDQQYFLEKALFQYPLFTRTPFEQIKTTPSNHVLVYDGSRSFSRHTNIADYYVDAPQPWRKALDQLSEVFIEQGRAYIPEERFCATLTGGFDGRTAVGLAMAMNRPFYTYSYGLESTLDVKVPRMVSQALNFPYEPLILGQEYSRQHFWANGVEFLSSSYGLGNISRAHYAYALKTVLAGSRYLLSGNFGSEIIRSMKIPGVMTSGMLFKLFENPEKATLRNSIMEHPALKYLSPSLVERCLDNMLDELASYLDNLPQGLSANKRFYIYLYEEVFSKYFGPEITLQRRFLNHRAPFLNFKFIQELLKTGIAGANSSFMETNPFKRYHGQVLYAHILKRTTPQLLDLPLDRGYNPRFFLTSGGPLRIAAGFALRKLLKRKAADIPDYSRQNTAQNLPEIRNIPLNPEIFDVAHFKHQFQGNWDADQMNFANMFSAAKYQSLIHEPSFSIA